jgi:hypothetical protein
MQETIANIVEKTSITKKDQFELLISKCIKLSESSGKESYSEFPNVVFDMDRLFKGFSPFNNELGKNKKYLAGVETLMIIFEELGIEVEKEECFILFHIRELGKFRIKETKLHEELKKLWSQGYHTFKMDDGEFSYALKSLMRKKLMAYRRGSIHFVPSVLIRYRTNN